MKKLPFNLCIAFLAGFLMNFVTPAFSSPTPTPIATIIPTPTVTLTPILEGVCLPVSATTGTATNITSNFATLNGSYDYESYDNLGYRTKVWFVYGTPEKSYETSSIESLDSNSNVSADVNGLTPSTTYYYYIVAETTAYSDCYPLHEFDIWYGEDKTFTTLPSVTFPTVSTGTATDIKSKSATLNGIVNANDALADVWFEYDTTIGSFSNTSSTQSLNGLNGTDTVSIDISGLSPDTTYYYRITAQNSVGTSYGSETSFTTNTPNPPSVITGSTTNVTSNSANLHGNVNANEFLTTVWFEYGKDSGSYSNTSSTTSVSDSDNLEVLVNISGLSANTTYFYRIAAQSNAGTSYGSERSFTTSVLPESSISGYVIDIKGHPLKSVKLILDGKKTLIPSTTFSDSNGFFAFYDLDADTYVIKASKKGYKRYKKTITLKEGEGKEIKIKIKKVNKRG